MEQKFRPDDPLRIVGACKIPGGNMPSYLQMIQSNGRNFTKAFRLLADYIETHTVEIAFLSIQELSSRTKVSTTTIHRFCQEIGLTGYAEFQKEIQKEMRERYNDEASHVDADGDSQSIFAAQCSSNIQVLQEIRASDAQMTENLNRAAQMLIGARRVYVTGLEGDYASACSAYYDFAKSLDNAFQITLDGGGYMDQIRTISADDVLYVISFRVYNRYILDIINCFLKVGAKVVTLADKGSPFNAFANVAIIPEHVTPSYGSVMKVTIQRALKMTIIQMLRGDAPA